VRVTAHPRPLLAIEEIDMRRSRHRASQLAWAFAVVATLAGRAEAQVRGPALYPEPILKTGGAPQVVALGDFNEDGHPDMAVPNASSNDLSVMLGLGGGTFAPQVKYPVGAFPYGAAVADFNLDGHDDIAVLLRNANLVAVLPGRGDGTFSAAITTTVGSTPISFATADFDDDGKPDLAVLTADTGTVAILLGRGDGRFTTVSTFRGPSYPSSLQVGDLNGDAKVDILVVQGTFSSLAPYVGRGDGTFSPLPAVNVGDVTLAAAIGDFDRDGINDLIVMRANAAQIAVLPGAGGGRFYSPIGIAQARDVRSIAVDDFNGDGYLDVAFTDIVSDGVYVMLGLGDFFFTPQSFYPAGDNPLFVVTGDLDGNASPDFAVANGASDDVSIFIGLGNGAFSARTYIALGSKPVALAVDDFDADGNLDIVAGSQTSDDVALLRGSGDGSFGTPERFSTGTDPVGLAVADFDGDGYRDLAVANYTSRDVSILLGHPGGGFETQRRIGVGGAPMTLAVGDFNNDGRPDLVVPRENSTTLAVLLGAGNGDFEMLLTSASFREPAGVVVIDADKNGSQDLVVIDSFYLRGAYLLSGRGDGTFGAPVLFLSMDDLRDAAVADGNDDLALVSGFMGTVSVIPGRGDGTFGPPLVMTTSVNPVGVTLGDFNGDGAADIATCDSYFGDVSLYLGHGDGTFEPLTQYRAPGIRDLVNGDLNGDGRVDLVAAESGSGGLWILAHNPRLFNAPPVANAGDDRALECSSPEGASVVLDGSASVDPDSTPGTNDDIKTFQWFESFGGPYQTLLGTGSRLSVTLALGLHFLTLQVTDARGASATAQATVTVVDSTPPIVVCPFVSAAECSMPGGAAVGLMATASDACSPTLAITNNRTGGGADASGFYPLGMTGVVFMATDTSGNTATCASSVVVRDTMPPYLTLTLSPTTLWPPNHRIMPVLAPWHVNDVCDPSAGIVLVSAASSEPDDAQGSGDGSTTGDIQDASIGTADMSVLLRAERSGDGPGRVYTLTYVARDASGNMASALGIVTVPHDEGTGPEPLMMSVEGDGTQGMAHLYWNAVNGAEMYDVIQGDLSQVSASNGEISLGPVHVLASGQTAASYSEGPSGSIPAAGSALFYLVQYREGQNASGWGTESSPWPAEPSACDIGCPGEPVASSVTSMSTTRE
jgi:hypothetical protein